MLKIRLQGTVNDIKWFQKIIKGLEQVKSVDFSEPFANKGTKKICSSIWRNRTKR